MSEGNGESEIMCNVRGKVGQGERNREVHLHGPSKRVRPN